MTMLFHHILTRSAELTPDATALEEKNRVIRYGELAEKMERVAGGLLHSGLKRHDRVGVYLPKSIPTVAAFFATSLAGGVVPQVKHILDDCSIGILITSSDRLKMLLPILQECTDLRTIVLVDVEAEQPSPAPHLQILPWRQLMDASAAPLHRTIDTDMVTLLYTSGSTGKPKGVVISHRNLVTGAHSVAEYLEVHAEDRVLSVLPLSFDYGLNQVTTPLLKGATVVLMNYLFPKEVINQLERQRITGLAGVPPLWTQLAQFTWPEGITEHLRYITNSGCLAHGDPRDAAPNLATHRNLFDVWPHRGIPLHLAAPGRDRPASRFHRQGDPECRGDGGQGGWNPLRAPRAR